MASDDNSASQWTQRELLFGWCQRHLQSAARWPRPVRVTILCVPNCRPRPRSWAGVCSITTLAFDAGDPAATAADDGAIATDKSPLLPGGTATLANYTSYSRGINGLLIDVMHLQQTPTVADFSFRIGNDNNPAAGAAGRRLAASRCVAERAWAVAIESRSFGSTGRSRTPGCKWSLRPAGRSGFRLPIRFTLGRPLWASRATRPVVPV